MYGPDDPGGGPPVIIPGEAPSLRWWFDDEAPQSVLSWDTLLAQWDAIETDFHHFYGVDFGGGALHARSWRWFRVRLMRLLVEESQLARALRSKKDPPDRAG